jgi:hypothetical protein
MRHRTTTYHSGWVMSREALVCQKRNGQNLIGRAGGNEWEGEFHMQSEKEEGENGRSGRVE